MGALLTVGLASLCPLWFGVLVAQGRWHRTREIQTASIVIFMSAWYIMVIEAGWI